MTIASVIFTEGFDKYGPPCPLNSVFSAATLSSLFSGEWDTLALGGTVTLVAPLIGTGCAIKMVQGSSTTSTLKKDLGVAYGRAVGGIWLKIDALPDRQYNFLTFSDPSNNIQFGLALTATGAIALTQTGGATVVVTSPILGLGTVHHLTWDVTISATGAYNVYLDNVSFGSGTGNFKASTASTYRFVTLGCATGSSTGSQNGWNFDSLWLGDDTGTPLLTFPVVETDFASGDSSVAFTVGAGALGWWFPTVNATNAPGANQLYLRKVTCPAGGATMTGVNAYMGATSAGAKFRAVLYADNAGTPNAQSLLASATSDTVGATALTVMSSAFATPYAMTGGTSYWIGFITDTSVAIYEADAGVTGVKAANTYTSGPPGTCPTVTTGQNNWCLWGTMTGVNNNHAEVGNNPTPNFLGGDYSYTTSSTVNAEDLFTFPALAVTPTAIHAVAIKGYLRDSDAGVRTVTMNLKSSATDSTGSLAAVQPITSYAWKGSYFLTDPNGSIAWTTSNHNAATGGYKIAS